MAQTISTNTFTAAKWIVSSDATQGTHTTIAGALTSASSGDTILIRTGTYTENPTLKAGVNLVALDGDANTPNVTIIGKCTMTTAGTVSISNIRLQTNSDFFLAVTGSAASIVNLNNCYLNASNNQGISFTSSSASATISCNDCSGDVGSNTKFFDTSSAGTLTFRYCTFNNSGAATTASTASAGVLAFSYTQITSPVTTSGTNFIASNWSNFNTSSQNATPLTVGGSGANNSSFDYFSSGTASAISIGATLTIASPTVVSSNTNAITGAGTVYYSNAAFLGASQTINTTTQTISGTVAGSRNTNPTAGFLGEQLLGQLTLASATSISNNTAKTITSVNLTAGVWDVGAMGAMRGTSTGTEWAIGISATNNTITSNYGYDFASTPTTSTTTTDSYVVIPKIRVTVSTTTTYYLVGLALFSVGTPTVYGTINATRVG